MKLSAAALGLSLLVCATQVYADPAEHADRRGDRIEHRLDQRGDRAENRLDRRGDQVDRRLDRRGRGIDRRMDRRATRV
jgi:hypothetical protein